MYQLNPLLEALDNKDYLALAGGAVSSGAAYNMLSGNHDDIFGTVTTYHNTATSNVPSIKDKGILAKYSTDPKNLTNYVLNDVPMKDKAGIVYLAKDKDIADGVGSTRKLHGIDKETSSKLKEIFGNDGTTLKVRMSPEEFSRLNIVNNPELRGVDSGASVKDFFNYMKKSGKLKVPKNATWESLDDITKSVVQMEFDEFKMLGKRTVSVKGDIPAKYIVGSKHYKNATNPKQWLKYVEKNPKRFAKGIGRTAGGLAALASVAYLGKKVYDRHHKGN